jgi:hypothetical protein
MPISFDDFSTGTFDSFGTFDQSPAKLLGESRRLKKKSSVEIIPDAPTRRSNAAGQAFSNRYDFGASLSAAIQTASSALGDRSGLQFKDEDRPEYNQTYREVASANRAPSSEPPTGKVTMPAPTTTPAQKAPATTQNVSAPGINSRGRVPGTKEVPGTTEAGTGTSRAAPLFADKPTLSSSSYQELVDKYCFVCARRKETDP